MTVKETSGNRVFTELIVFSALPRTQFSENTITGNTNNLLQI